MSEATYELVGCRITSRATDRPQFTVRATHEDPEGWDRFAQACGATFRGAYWGAFGWQLRHHLAFVLRRYDIFACGSDGNAKIGQFVIGMGRQKRVFGDVLHLLPAYQDLWSIIMGNVLRELGPAVYHYGSDWTTEPARTASISGIRGATIITEQSIDVYAVKFSDYSSWDDLYRNLSSNVRRNVVSANRCGIDIFVQRSLRRILIDKHRLLQLKRNMFLRKGLEFNSIRAYIALVSRICSFRKYLLTAKALGDDRTVSLFSGLQFGRDLYYLEGASINHPGGAAWLLLISMLQSTFDQSRGLGICVLGPDEKEPRTPPAQLAWQNLLRQRLQCRAKPYPTSFVTFRYAGDGPAADRPATLPKTSRLLRVGEARWSPVNFERS